MHKEDQLKQEAEVELSRISEICFQLRAKKERVEVRLAELRKTLPDILSDCVLGLIPKERVDELKKAISDAQTFLEDYPLIDQGLERKSARAQAQSRRATRLSEHRASYEEAKAQLDIHDPSSIDNLRAHAAEIGEVEECERFLVAFEKPKV